MEDGERSRFANLRTLYSVLANGIPVFVLFLFVSVLQYRHRINLTIAQTRYLPVLFQVWTLVGKWDWIIPCYSKT